MALEVRVVTPEREVWSGQAEMVVAHGAEGDVGILQGHAPLLIRLVEGTVRIHTGGGQEQIPVGGGFLHVTSDGGGTRVDVLADASSGPTG